MATAPDSAHPKSTAALSTPPKLPGRFISVGVKLTLTVVAVLALASAYVVVELTGRARASLIEQKRSAGVMVVGLFSASVSAAADFGDEEELKSEVKNLGTNPDIVYASVWLQEGTAPAAELGRLPGGATRPSNSRRVSVLEDRIIIDQPLTRPGGEPVGALTVHLTLEPENAQYAATRRQILLYALALGGLLAALVLAVVRGQVVVPLGRLDRGIGRVQQGLAAEVKIHANDEVGRLAASFNAMATAIVDREQRLAELNHRLQQLLDHMREAILVFGEYGRVESIQSREAQILFGEGITGRPVKDLLFPETSSGVETEAFEAWLGVAFSVPIEQWDEVAELAPRETTLVRGDGEERVLVLEFRPILEGDQLRRVMVLATDETDKRRLERTVKENREEHARQIAAMRKLVAGGGQLLVQVLDGARARLRDSAATLAAAKGAYDNALNSQLFHWVHTVKGEARAFDLTALERASARLEDELAKLRGRLREGDRLEVETVRVRLEPLLEAATNSVADAERLLVEASPIGPAILEQVTVRRADLNRLGELVGSQADDVKRLVERLRSRPFGESALSLVESAPRWASRVNKRVRVEVEGRDVPIPPGLARALSGALTHLVRNAIAHGIESVDEREQLGKPVPARITLHATDGPEGPTIRVSDDGQGLDHAALVDGASALSVDSSRSAEELAFTPGVSTQGDEKASDLAGFGMGLSAVRSELLGVGYEVSLNSSQGAGTEVVLSPRAAPGLA